MSRIETLNRQLECLRTSIEQSREERTRQECVCRELGQSAEQVKAWLIEAQEGQAQDMTQAQEIETAVDVVRKAVSALRDTRMSVEVRRAEVRTQLGTVESTLSGTYQVDPMSLIETFVADPTSEMPQGEAESMLEVVSTPTEDELRQQIQKIRAEYTESERKIREGPCRAWVSPQRSVLPPDQVRKAVPILSALHSCREFREHELPLPPDSGMRLRQGHDLFGHDRKADSTQDDQGVALAANGPHQLDELRHEARARAVNHQPQILASQPGVARPVDRQHAHPVCQVQQVASQGNRPPPEELAAAALPRPATPTPLPGTTTGRAARTPTPRPRRR